MIKILFQLFLIIFLILPQRNAFCNPLSVIRDTQMEQYALKGIKKLFKSAGLNDENAQVVFINDLSLNAFVTGGSVVYIHAGLITQTDYSDEFFGVLAHETGHVVGGHTIRLIGEMEKAQNTALITTVLGGIAAVASGRGDVGMAIMLGGMTSASGLLSAYRQTEENSADSIAIDLINKSGFSVAGLHKVMRKIEKEERLRIDNLPNYLRSHPLTKDRIRFLEQASKDAPQLKEDEEYTLIKAKLFAFLKEPEQTRVIYNGSSNADLYAQSIADFKETKIQDALNKINKLIENEPQNPYFYEIKGQILFETGRVNEAIDIYTQAHQLLPNASLIRLSLAQALLETENNENIAQAIEHLNYITIHDKYLPDAWYFLYIAYAKKGQYDLSNYYKIEHLLLTGKNEEIKQILPKTKKAFEANVIKSNRLADIEEIIK